MQRSIGTGFGCIGRPGLAAAALAFLAALPSCSPKSRTGPETVTETRTLMGTLVTVTATCDRGPAQEVVDLAFRDMANLEVLLSKHRAESEVSRINASAGKSPVKVSGYAFETISLALEVSRLSDGAFDVTVEPVLRLWKDASSKRAMPSAEAVEEARGRTGYGGISLDRQGRTVALSAGMSLDLGGIAKGYIVDKAVERLKNVGASSGLVEAGGDLYAFGRKQEGPSGSMWRVGIQDPRDPEGSTPVAVIEFTDSGVTTSGHYRRFATIGGRRISHIVDPRTGMPVDNDVLSVTVKAPSAALADGLSTAVAVLGEEKGLALIASVKGAECLILSKDGASGLRKSMSAGMAGFIKE